MRPSYNMTREEPVAWQDVSTRATFITRTYMHLLGAILLFVLLEMWLFSSGLAEQIAGILLGVSWLVVLGGFMVVGWFASKTALRSRSVGAQYAALGAFVLAEAIIFVPLLFLATAVAPGAIESAASVTILGFAALTGVVHVMRRDFSFLAGALRWGFIMAIVLIVASVIFGFNLGTFFSVGMIALAGGAILYDTSNVMNHFPQDRHVGAALQLFASVALLFWYVLTFFIQTRD